MGYSREHRDADFIKRTVKIIAQYEAIDLPKNERYDVTLLLNCLVGLLIVPEQKWLKTLPTELVSLSKWGISPESISTITKRDLTPEDKNIQNVARHLRNSISHYRFELLSDANGEIDRVEFLDSSDRGMTFQSTLTTENIRTFVASIASFLTTQGLIPSS